MSNPNLMYVRNATYKDAPDIKMLLKMLNVMPRLSNLVNQIELLFDCEERRLYLVEDGIEVFGFAMVHFLPGLTCKYYLAHVSYLVMTISDKTQAALKVLESHIVKESDSRNCDLIRIDGDNSNLPEALLASTLGYNNAGKIHFKKVTCEVTMRKSQINGLQLSKN